MPVIQISTLGIEDDIREAILSNVWDEKGDLILPIDTIVEAVKKAVLDREVLCNCDVEKSMQRCLE
jgi:hypothetical protein